MLNVIFWIVSIAAVVSAVYHIVVKKDLYGVSTYILLGVYLPLFMSFLDWSYYHISDKGEVFYYIFILFGMIFFIFNLLSQSRIMMTNLRFSIKKRKRRMPVGIYNLIYIACVLIENYYISGTIFPNLFGMDVHTLRMPYIYFITTGIYILSLLNILEFFCTKKKRYLLYLVMSLLINVVTKSARVDAFICVVQIVSLCGFYYLSKRNLIKERDKIKQKKKKRWPAIILLGCLMAGIITYSLDVGNDRMNKFGLYSMRYEDGIGYQGPEFIGEVLPYYYGYFALSFDNLAYNTQQQESTHNYLGLNTFRTLYFGILQFDNLLGLTGSEATQENVIRCSGAAVATGFWDMYYDYGILICVPFIISFAIYVFLRKKVTKPRVQLLALAVYFYWVPIWMFLSFDNRLYDYQVLWHIIIMALLLRNRYEMEYDEISGLEAEKNPVAPSFKNRKRLGASVYF